MDRTRLTSRQQCARESGPPPCVTHVGGHVSIHVTLSYAAAAGQVGICYVASAAIKRLCSYDTDKR